MKQYTVGWFVELAYMPNKHILQLLFLAIVHSGEISNKKLRSRLRSGAPLQCKRARANIVHIHFKI